MAWRDNARGLLGGAGRFANGVNGILFPGYNGLDEQAAQRARAQAMMQMGAGLLGGQQLGQAYGLAQQSGWEPIEQARRQAYMEQATKDREEQRAYREWQQKRAEEQDRREVDSRAQQTIWGNRDRMHRRFDNQSDEQARKAAFDESVRHNKFMESNAASDNARADRQVRQGTLTAQAGAAANQYQIERQRAADAAGRAIAAADGDLSNPSLAPAERQRAQAIRQRAVNQYRTYADREWSANPFLDAAAMAGAGAGAPQAAAQSNMPAAGALPEGVPQGSVMIGTSGGKPVYQTPDGKRLILR